MRSVTGVPAPAPPAVAVGVVALPLGPTGPVLDLDCRWCGGPAAWSWSLGDRADGAADVPAGAVPDEVRVCDACQALSLADDDAAVLARCLTALAAGATYPVAMDFLSEHEARSLADWVGRRTTVRVVEPGVVTVRGADR